MRKLIPVYCLLLLGLVGRGQENLNYQKPDAAILNLADYERVPSVSMNSKKTYVLYMYRSTYKSLDDLNQEEVRLGGLRLNPATNISSTATYSSNIKLRPFSKKVETQVQGLPQNAKISNISWSRDETKVSFTNTTDTGVELWYIDLAKNTAHQLTEAITNCAMGNPASWTADSQRLLVRVLPKNRPALLSEKKSLPSGPIVSTSDGSVSQNRTYQDLLKNKLDEQNFETLVTSELQYIDLNGKVTPFLPANLYTGISFSPDGNYVMVNTLEKPFSYIVPYSRFPMRAVVYDKNGKEVKEVSYTPLTEVMPKGFMAVKKGKRNLSWRSDKPSTLFFAEALDEGNPANKVDFRDELFQWPAPFNSNPTSFMKVPQRFGGLIWGDDQTAIVVDSWYDTRNQKAYIISPATSNPAPKVISDRNSQDVYSDPGNFETVKNEYGFYVLAQNNGQAYLIGDGYTKEGQFPFVDAFDLKTLKTKRLYQSTFKDKKEEILSIEDFKKGIALVQIQSATEYPNYYFRNINKKNDITPITSFKSPFSGLDGIHKEVIKYNRKDGVQLSGTLYLPKGYDKKKGEKLPLLIWAYPEEYKDKSSAGQSTHNPNEFTFPYYGSFVYWVTRGYAVLDDASFPIIGEGDVEPNDTFVQQLVDNAEAAINAVDKMGYIDRKRVGVGGHSYGAFMTANLLTHSNLFACGIARSGAYNRTLTPFGFQGEQRNYWEVPEVYNTMSPFMNAGKMKTPMLLVHGEADNNPGTFTLQTERYFQALKGLGAPVRMVILPKESHSYVAKENIFHLLWEQDQFLEKYLKPQSK